ncbi:MAG TPA: 23S rRNA pseudouridine(1911/1915/1917) synthase RluD, partial [Gammaproteobacteria bacterium]|nr:23S rRNA pseudouridine(1911/1915/1917) synthase RluD [Gammaproteobacteria bacterium]
KEVLEGKVVVPEQMKNARLDKVLSELFPSYSRTKLVEWLDAGFVRVNDKIKLDRKTKMQGGECIVLCVELQNDTTHIPQALSLDIVYEDDHILIIQKKAGQIVHPGAGNRDNTLLNGLIYARPELGSLPRAGIVHRLDKDTSGLMVVAKTLSAHHGLVKSLQMRTIDRHYYALCQGTLISGGTIHTSMGRHPTNRIKMAVTTQGKEAITHYRVEKKFRAHTLIDVKLETGRTHQIRVHMAHLGFPLVGDPLYGRLKFPKKCSHACKEALANFKRQALHAYRLHFKHPITQEVLDFKIPLPEDFAHLLEIVKNDDSQQLD